MLSVKSSEFDAEPPFVLDEGFTNFLCLSSFGVFNEHLFKFCCSAIVNFKLNFPPPPLYHTSSLWLLLAMFIV